MLFNSQPFVLLFLPIVLGLYYAARGVRARQVVLVLASLVFYGYWDWRFVPALVALTFAELGCCAVVRREPAEMGAYSRHRAQSDGARRL